MRDLGAHERTEIAPKLVSWASDAYADSDPAVVAPELVAAGSGLADHFAELTDEQWARTGHRDDGKDFTVDSFARYFLHDIEHHLHDVGG